MLDELIQHQANAYRASTAVVNELNKQFNSSSNALASELRDILDELSNAERAALVAGKYTTDRLKDFKSVFDEWYQTIAVTLPELFLASSVAYVAYESAFMAQLYGESAEVKAEKVVSAFRSAPVASGALFDELFKDLAESTRKQALYAIRQGIQDGLTNQQIVAEIRGKRTKDGYVGGIVEQAKHRIEANVRTARSTLANDAYQEVFDVLGYEYVKFVSVLDGRTTKQCASLDSSVWKKDDSKIKRPPLHFNCRSLLMGTDKDGNVAGKRPFVAADKPVSKIPKDERDGIIGQVNANTKYKTWFDRQDAKFQKDWLGETRYKLYKEGGYPIDKFIDPLGKEYTIAELEALDKELFKRLGL